MSFDVILLLQCYFKCVNHSFVFCPKFSACCMHGCFVQVVCVCMYVCVEVYVHVSVWGCVWKCYVYIHVCVNVCVHTGVHTLRKGRVSGWVPAVWNSGHWKQGDDEGRGGWQAPWASRGH